MIDDLSELIEIESVYSDDGVLPFGAGVKKSIDWFVDKAKNYGLVTGTDDGYSAYAEYGKGKKCIGILCHLDVVPAGSGWSYPPYKLTIDNGNLYGRGVVDNKGSAIIALHVLKNLAERKIKTKNRIRLIVGGGEENGSACLKHYATHQEIPKMSIVPDADFPIINSEKAISHLKLTLPMTDEFLSCVTSFDGGNRVNVVPNHASIVIKSSSVLGKKLLSLAGKNRDNSVLLEAELATKLLIAGYKISDFSIKFLDDKIVLDTTGKSCHAMVPDEGDNAIWKAFAFLDAFTGTHRAQNLGDVTQFICSPSSPERLGIAAFDDVSGELTINLGIVKLDGKNLIIELDIRCPLSANIEDVKDKIGDIFGTEKLTETYYAKNLFIEKSSPLIQTLLEVYTSSTGLTPSCIKTGGGTYARELPNAVAFGPTFPGQVTNIHNADEYISMINFDKLFEIYFKAVIALDDL